MLSMCNMFGSVSYKWIACAGDISGEIDAELLLKEFKGTSVQEKFDKELREIDKRLEQKEVKRSPIERVTSSHLFTIQRRSSFHPHTCSMLFKMHFDCCEYD